MDYEKIYFSIIENRKNNKFVGYTEKHHILPRSLGGSDEKDNIVSLSAREHYICHLLLTKMYDKGTNEYYKMIHAYMMMCNAKSENHMREYKVNSRLYANYKIEFSKLMKIKQTGKSNNQYETKWIYSNNLRESKKVHKEYELTGDWKLGRVMKFDYLEKTCELCNIHLNCKSPFELKRFCELCRRDKNIKKNKELTSKKCVCSGIEFNSLSDASKELDISIQLIRYRIKSINFNDYYYM